MICTNKVEINVHNILMLKKNALIQAVLKPANSFKKTSDPQVILISFMPTLVKNLLLQ